MIEQEGLFPPPEQPPVRRPAGVQPDKPEGVRYTNYRPKQRIHCDDCVTEIRNDTPERAPYPRGARYRRTEGTEVVVVCAAHRAARETEEKHR